MISIACVVIMLVLLIWRVRRGFTCGMMQEIANILSGAAALVCVVLILFAINSVRGKTMHVFAACIVVLVLLGICFKICSLILRPLLAVDKICIVSGINKFLGAILGVVEACLLAFIIIKVVNYFGVSVF